MQLQDNLMFHYQLAMEPILMQLQKTYYLGNSTTRYLWEEGFETNPYGWADGRRDVHAFG